MDSGKTFRCPCCNRWLGHANPETTMQYIDKFWREKKEALEAWAKKLAPLGPMFMYPEITQRQIVQE